MKIVHKEKKYLRRYYTLCFRMHFLFYFILKNNLFFYISFSFIKKIIDDIMFLISLLMKANNINPEIELRSLLMKDAKKPIFIPNELKLIANKKKPPTIHLSYLKFAIV